jgi:hypothetical protein
METGKCVEMEEKRGGLAKKEKRKKTLGSRYGHKSRRW